MKDLFIPATFILGFMVAVTFWMIITQRRVDVQDSQIEELLKEIKQLKEGK